MTSLRSSIRSTSPAQCGRIRSGGRVAAISPREGVHPTVSFGGIVWITEMVIYFKGRKSSHIASHCITLLYNDGPLGEPPDEFTNKVVFCIQKLWGLICMICINLWHMIFFFAFFFCGSFVLVLFQWYFTILLLSSRRVSTSGVARDGGSITSSSFQVDTDEKSWDFWGTLLTLLGLLGA